MTRYWQKSAQLGNDELKELMEMCCLWEWLTPVMERTLGTGAQKLKEAWAMGSLGLIITCILAIEPVCRAA